MRTTINIEDDLAEALKREANAKRRPFTDVVNSAIRAGLAKSSAGKAPFVVKTFPGKLAPGIDPDRLGELAQGLEDEVHIQRLRRQL